MNKNHNIKCGLFDFMVYTLGIKVLHPGGYKSTTELCSLLELDKDSHVLDVACGTGTTSFFLAKKYNCKVTGFDISKTLIEIANKNLIKNNYKDKITFEVADALKIPYPDSYFDSVISQAFFILIDDKVDALKEIVRVLKPGGFLGALELSWLKKPPEDIYEEFIAKTCNDFIPRVIQFDEWENFFRSVSLRHKTTFKHPMKSSMLEMFATEGISNSLKIIFKMIGNSENRQRMMNVQNTFSKYNDYLGYGIYAYEKY